MTDLQVAVSMLEQHGLSSHNVSRERNIRESFGLPYFYYANAIHKSSE